MEFAKNGCEYVALRETTQTEGAAADVNGARLRGVGRPGDPSVLAATPRSRAHTRAPAAGYPQSLTGEGATRQGPALHETAQREVDGRRPGGELPGRLATPGARAYSPRVATFRSGIPN